MNKDLSYVLPDKGDPGWKKNDVRSWPHLTYEDLIDYLITSKAYDGKEMRAFRATYGYNYVQNGWLGDIYHIEKDMLVWMQAMVSPSQPGAGRMDYTSWILLEKDDSPDSYSIKTASCTCPAGLGRACSHVSSIAYAVSMAWVHGLAGHSCTDLPVAWGKGSASKTDHQDKLKEIDFSRPKVSSVPLIHEPNTSNQKEFRFQKIETHSDLETFAMKSTISKLWQCQGTLLHKILNAPAINHSVNFNCVPVHGNHDINYNVPVTHLNCEPCNSFYNKYVTLTEDKINQLTIKTEKQNTSLWMDSRRVRIPASKLSAVPKTQRADPAKFINNHLYTRFKGNASTEPGKTSEPKARNDFELSHNCSVHMIGTVVNKDDPFLSASPDGVITDDTLLEIKCPIKPISELTSDNSKKYDIVRNEQGHTINKKGRNGYYYQIQMQMHCTKAKHCKLFIWNSDPNEQIVLDIHYDKEFIAQLLPRVRTFFFKHMLVRLVDDFHAKRFKLCDEYKRFCTT